MNSSNPLIEKWEQLYGKKEPPKMPRIEDYEGEDFEVWVSAGNNLSNVVKSVWSLNLRNDGCDIILE